MFQKLKNRIANASLFLFTCPRQSPVFEVHSDKHQSSVYKESLDPLDDFTVLDSSASYSSPTFYSLESDMASTSEVAYDIPPQIFDFTEWIGELTAEVAGGTFGTVYRASLGDKGRAFLAVKVPRRIMYKTQQDAIKAFNFEISSWTKVGYHPYVLRLFGIVYTNKSSATPQPCFLSEWQENGELREYMRDSKDACILTMVSQILEGVKHIHSVDVIHGDLRGGNILVASDGTPRIADFGLSKQRGRESSKSIAKGTLRWMAKELVSCIESAVSPSPPLLGERRSKGSDIWSLGMTFLEILSGKDPYYDVYYEHWVMFSITSGELPAYPGPHREEWKGIDQKLWNVCTKCWCLEPSNRPTAEDLIKEVEKIKLGDANTESTAGVSAIEEEQLGHVGPSLNEGNPSEQQTHRSVTHETISQARVVEHSGLISPPSSISTDGRRASTIGQERRTASSSHDFEVIDAEFADMPLPPHPLGLDNPSFSCKTTLINVAAKKKLRIDFAPSETGDLSQWECLLKIDGRIRGHARQNSKKDAEEEASRQVLADMSANDPSVAALLPRYSSVFKKFLEKSHLQNRIKWQGRDEGEAHLPTWRFVVERDGHPFADGVGGTKKEAEDAATRNAAIVWRSRKGQ